MQIKKIPTQLVKKNWEHKQIDVYPICPLEHSMGPKVFMRYVGTKFTGKQFSLLSIAISNNFKIECHGILNNEIEDFILKNNYKIISDHISRKIRYKKICNSIKPVWILIEDINKEKKLIIFTAPGIENLQQYSMLLTTAVIFLLSKGRSLNSYQKSIQFIKNCRFYHYDFKHFNYTKLIGLDDFLKENKSNRGSFIIGDIALETLKKEISNLHTLENEYYFDEFSIVDINLNNSKNKITFVMIKPSFWGSLAGQIADSCIKNGKARDIIYVAKLGAIDKNIKTFDLVNPNNFFLSNTSMRQIAPPPPSISSDIINKYNIVSTTHVSVPTVMEETTVKINFFSSININTIDNEISYIAKAISDHNSTTNDFVKFSCLHMVTDMPSSNIIGSIEDQIIDTNHLLSKSSFIYRNKKEGFHKKAISIIFENFDSN